MPSATVIAGGAGGRRSGGASLFVLRRWPRATFAVAWVVYLVLAGLRDSRGKIMHNDVLLLLASVPFLAAPLARDRRDRAPDARLRLAHPHRHRGRQRSATSSRATGSSCGRASSWVTSDNVRLSIAWGPKPAVGRWDCVRRFRHARARGSVKLIAAFTLAFELSFPIALFVRRARVRVCRDRVRRCTSSTYFLFGLDYWAWIGVLWILFVDWPAVVARWQARRRRRGIA